MLAARRWPTTRVALTTRALATIALASVALAYAIDASARDRASTSVAELKPLAVLHLGKTADWVAIAPDAVWVGGTDPNAVHRIDPRTNARIATVALDGEPCAGLATGLGALWVPLCGTTPRLARIDLASGRLVATFDVAGVQAEGGVTTSENGVWLVVDKDGGLVRVDPDTGEARQKVRVPGGSFNPKFSDGIVWVTHAGGAEITAVDAKSGKLRASVPTGPGPRFLATGGGAIWTLNQGDGSLTRIDASGAHATKTIALDTPGHGGDIAFGADMIWTTMMKTPLTMIDAQTTTLRCQWTGTGGDSLAIGFGAIWLTDYHAGTISRYDVDATKRACDASRAPPVR